MTALTLAAALSCVKEEGAVRGCASEDGLIRFSAQELIHVSSETKAVETTTANLTSVYVTATNGTPGTGGEKTAFVSTLFTKDAGGSFRANEWWPKENPSYHFYGSSAPMSFTGGACTVTATNDKDVVCAFLETPAYGKVNTLELAHVFARIGTVSFSAPRGYTLSDVTTRITPRVGGAYNIRTGNGHTDGTGWSSVQTGQQTAISAANNGLYLVPGDYTLSVSYTLSRAGVTGATEWTKSYTRNATVSLQGGATNNLVGTVSGGDASEIQLTITLSQWETEDHTPEFK